MIFTFRFNCVIKSPANKTPEKDLEYAYEHIQSCAPEFTGEEFTTVVDVGNLMYLFIISAHYFKEFSILFFHLYLKLNDLYYVDWVCCIQR